MNISKLRGKSVPEIRELVKDQSREELIALLAAAISVEPLYKPGEIGILSKKRRRDVLAAVNAFEMGDYYCYGPNSLAVPASGVNAWRQRWLVRAPVS